MLHGATVGQGSRISPWQGWARATLLPWVLTRSNLSPHSPLPPPCFNPFLPPAQRCSRLLPPYHSSPSSSSLLFLLWQIGSEMAVSGEAVSLYFEEKLQQAFPGQSFPESPEPMETQDTTEKAKEEDETDESDDDFVQPRRKRLKADEKVVHIKWEMWKKLSSSHFTLLICLR